MQLETQWIVGFVDGEGCFHVSVNAHEQTTSGFQVLPEFVVVQHERDVQILHALKRHFGCGVVRRNHAERMCYRVRGVKHLNERVIPFFEQHPLKTRKNVEFRKFRRILRLMAAGGHLDDEGIEKIRSIAAQMNRGAIKVKSDLSGNS